MSSAVANCCAKLSVVTATLAENPSRVFVAMPETDPSTFVDKRIKELRLSVRRVAAMAGISHTHLGNLIKGIASWKEVQLSTLEGLAYALDVSVSDFVALVRGKESLDLRSRADAIPTGYRIVQVSGADGGKPLGYSEMLIEEEDYRPGCRAFKVTGDSMYNGPESIQDGDRVLVDTRILQLQERKVYVFEIIGDGYTVKRARLFGNEWWMVPDNPDPKYTPLRESEVVVIGQVYKVIPASRPVR